MTWDSRSVPDNPASRRFTSFPPLSPTSSSRSNRGSVRSGYPTASRAKDERPVSSELPVPMRRCVAQSLHGRRQPAPAEPNRLRIDLVQCPDMDPFCYKERSGKVDTGRPCIESRPSVFPGDPSSAVSLEGEVLRYRLRRCLLIASGTAELTNDAIECCGDALRSTDLVFLGRRIPI